MRYPPPPRRSRRARAAGALPAHPRSSYLRSRYQACARALRKLADRSGSPARKAVRAAGELQLMSFRREEIGRAPRKERGCNDAYILGVGVVCQKKEIIIGKMTCEGE